MVTFCTDAQIAAFGKGLQAQHTHPADFQGAMMSGAGAIPFHPLAVPVDIGVVRNMYGMKPAGTVLPCGEVPRQFPGALPDRFQLLRHAGYRTVEWDKMRIAYLDADEFSLLFRDSQSLDKVLGGVPANAALLTHFFAHPNDVPRIWERQAVGTIYFPATLYLAKPDWRNDPIEKDPIMCGMRMVGNRHGAEWGPDHLHEKDLSRVRADRSKLAIVYHIR